MRWRHRSPRATATHSSFPLVPIDSHVMTLAPCGHQVVVAVAVEVAGDEVLDVHSALLDQSTLPLARARSLRVVDAHPRPWGARFVVADADHQLLVGVVVQVDREYRVAPLELLIEDKAVPQWRLGRRAGGGRQARICA